MSRSVPKNREEILRDAVEQSVVELRGWAEMMETRAGRAEGASPEDLQAMAEEWFRKVALELEIAAAGGLAVVRDRGLIR